jgi:RNA polymerase sigma-70 factor (ECF subfamily)
VLRVRIESLEPLLRGPMLGWLKKRVPASVAEDIVQEALLRGWQAAPKLRDPAKLQSVIWSTARNLSVDYLRAQRPAGALEELYEAPPEPDVSAVVASWLPGFVEMLEEPYRTAVKRVDLEGITQAQLADELGLSKSGARSRVQRGRAQLHDLLQACCEVHFAQDAVQHVAPRKCGAGC